MNHSILHQCGVETHFGRTTGRSTVVNGSDDRTTGHERVTNDSDGVTNDSDGVSGTVSGDIPLYPVKRQTRLETEILS